MKQVKAILFGGAALLIAAASATADPIADTQTGAMSVEDSTAGASTQYPVDDDRDGRADRMLILEQSDSLA
jgi:hypothetical protein